VNRSLLLEEGIDSAFEILEKGMRADQKLPIHDLPTYLIGLVVDPILLDAEPGVTLLRCPRRSLISSSQRTAHPDFRRAVIRILKWYRGDPASDRGMRLALALADSWIGEEWGVAGS